MWRRGRREAGGRVPFRERGVARAVNARCWTGCSMCRTTCSRNIRPRNLHLPHQAMRVITDMFAWAKENVPEWNTISISGYHMREAGSTAVQEVAFTLGNGMAYVEAARLGAMGSPVFVLLQRAQQFSGRSSEVSRCPPHVGTNHARTFQGEKSEVVWMAALPYADGGFHLDRTATGEQHRAYGDSSNGGCMGGTQSLHTNSYDEALALPTEQAARIALRTQQIIAYDPGRRNHRSVGGFVLCRGADERNRKAGSQYLGKIEVMGGMLKAIERGFPKVLSSTRSVTYLSNSALAFTGGVNDGSRPQMLLPHLLVQVGLAAMTRHGLCPRLRPIGCAARRLERRRRGSDVEPSPAVLARFAGIGKQLLAKKRPS